MSDVTLASTQARVLRVRRDVAQSALARMGLSKTRALAMTRAYQERSDTVAAIADLESAVNRLAPTTGNETLATRVYRLRNEHAQLDRRATATSYLRSMPKEWAQALSGVQVGQFATGHYRPSQLRPRPIARGLIGKVTPAAIREAFNTSDDNQTVRKLFQVWGRSEQIASEILTKVPRERESHGEHGKRQRQALVQAIAVDKKLAVLLEELVDTLKVQPWRTRYSRLDKVAPLMASGDADAKRLRSFDEALQDAEKTFTGYFTSSEGAEVAKILHIKVEDEIQAGIVLCEIANGTELRAFMVAENSNAKTLPLDLLT